MRFKNVEDAQRCIEAYEHCSSCNTCLISTPAFRCGYIYEQAKKYLETHFEPEEK